MSDANGNEPNQPDYKVSLIRENVIKDGNTETRKQKWHDFGAGWNRKNGYVALDTPLGTLMLSPPEELERMRAEKEQQGQSQDHSNNPDNGQQH